MKMEPTLCTDCDAELTKTEIKHSNGGEPLCDACAQARADYRASQSAYAYACGYRD
jgi:hypothetical protein